MVCVHDGFLSKGPVALVLRHTHLGKIIPTECREGGSTWGKHFRQLVLAVCCLLKLAYAEELGMQVAPASTFVPKEGSPCLLPS